MILNVIIVAVLMVVVAAFVVGARIFLWWLPQEGAKLDKGLFCSGMLFCYLIVILCSFAGFIWFVNELINYIKIG